MKTKTVTISGDRTLKEFVERADFIRISKNGNMRGVSKIGTRKPKWKNWQGFYFAEFELNANRSTAAVIIKKYREYMMNFYGLSAHVTMY